MPMIIGFLMTFITAFFICAEPWTSLSAENVSMITEYMLKRGTADTIIKGVIPAEPYIFSTNAIPSIAALPRAAA